MSRVSWDYVQCAKCGGIIHEGAEHRCGLVVPVDTSATPNPHTMEPVLAEEKRFAMIAAIEAEIGRLMKALKELRRLG